MKLKTCDLEGYSEAQLKQLITAIPRNENQIKIKGACNGYDATNILNIFPYFPKQITHISFKVELCSIFFIDENG